MIQQDALNTYEVSNDDESTENESNNDESNENESNENESNENESSYDDDESSEEENPVQQWNIPNWRGNAPECLDTACPCIKQVVEDGSIRGCAECDDYWDMPSLVGDAEEIQGK